MFSKKELSEEQILEIKSWAEQGAQLADIQKRIRAEMKFPVTYMDTRFLILDLGIELQEEEKEEPAPEVPATPVPTGKTTLTADSVALPDSIISGRVEFSDGESAIWKIDQTGRPSLDPTTPGYQPSQEDILEFQTQLRELVEKSGM
ncbi:MAG: hypothetical protein AB8D78_03125 [Akkermansiaceae bacterium]